MRVWDVDPKVLCNRHLLGEHREMHGAFKIVTVHGCKGGYSNHPETIRWIGKSAALRNRHEAIVEEFRRRGWKSGFQHTTDMQEELTRGSDGSQTEFIDSIPRQLELLRNKCSECMRLQVEHGVFAV